MLISSWNPKRLLKIWAFALLCLLMLPFIFQVDVYPFLKFSMFARPNAAVQPQCWALYFQTGYEKPEEVFVPEAYNISPHFWAEWLKNAQNEKQKHELMLKVKGLVSQKKGVLVQNIYWKSCKEGH